MIEIRIKNIDELVKSFGKFNVKEMLNTALKKSVFALERTAKQNTPVDTGLLRNSYENLFGDLEATLRNYREYAPYVEAKQSFLARSIDLELPHIQSIFEQEANALLSKL